MRPVAGATPGDQNKTCRLALGESFKNLLDDCINVFKDPATDTLALNKVMGNLTHDDQNFTFSVVGVNQNYRPAALDLDGPRKFDVIHDSESPLDDPAHNFADDFTFDVRASGPILNDGYLTTDATKNVIFKSDNHGSGAIWREWGRLMQSDLASSYAATHRRPGDAESWPRSWHDPQCIFPMECQGGTAQSRECQHVPVQRLRQPGAGRRPVGGAQRLRRQPDPGPRRHDRPLHRARAGADEDGLLLRDAHRHDCAWYDKVKQLTHWQAPTDANGKLLLCENGKPLLDGYCGAFAPTAFALGSDAGLEIDEIASGSPGALPSPDPLTQTARVKIYDFAVPYDLKSKQTINEVLVPWKPKQEGVGFPVMNPASPLNDVFVETAQFEMTGQVMTPVIDFQDTYETDASNVTRHMATVQAVETEDFLGDVFLCVDPGTAANNAGTGRPGDVLAAHMYTSVASILEWLASHPGASDGCQIIVRYSPFNNYPDFIQGTANGVRLGVEQGAGFGRVSDVTIFRPGLGTGADRIGPAGA